MQQHPAGISCVSSINQSLSLIIGHTSISGAELTIGGEMLFSLK
jgi:hypothetical protein